MAYNPCEICWNEDAEYVVDPFEEAMNNKEVMRWLCPECQERLALET